MHGWVCQSLEVRYADVNSLFAVAFTTFVAGHDIGKDLAQQIRYARYCLALLESHIDAWLTHVMIAASRVCGIAVIASMASACWAQTAVQVCH